MKKVLVFAVAALVFASCGGKKTEEEAEKPEVHVEMGDKLPIGVVNVDSVLENYTLAAEANDALMSKQENARVELSQRAKALNNEMIEFQQKLENNAFLSRERAESEQNRLIKKQQQLEEFEQTKTQELMEEQQRLNKQIRDSIDAVVDDITATGEYHMILTTSSLNDNVLFCAPEYDITDKVVEMLNDRYKKK